MQQGAPASRKTEEDTYATPEENPLSNSPDLLGWRMRAHKRLILLFTVVWFLGIGMLVAGLSTSAWWVYEESMEVKGVASYFEAGALVTQHQHWSVALTGMKVEIRYCVNEDSTGTNCFTSVNSSTSIFA